MSKNSICKNLTCPYDTSLPQDWVNSITRTGFDPRGLVVWGYPKGSIFGIPVPLSPISAHKLLERSAAMGYSAERLMESWASVGVPVLEYFPRLQPLDPVNQIG